MEHLEEPAALVARAEEFLRAQQILLPAASTLRRLVIEERAAYRRRLFRRMMALLPEPVCEKLDELLVAGDEATSRLQVLKEPPGAASPRALLKESAKLKLIEETGILEVDLSWIRSSLRKAMARRIRYSDAHRVYELRAPHRYTALACFLHEIHAETVDTLVEMHAKLMTQTYRRAQNRLDEKLRTHRKALMCTLESFRTVTRLVLSGEVSDLDLRATVLCAIPAERLEQQFADAEVWLTGSRSDVFPLVRQRFSYLRQFSPTLLGHLAFEAEPDGTSELVGAIRLLQGLNEQGKRKVPGDAPVGFLTKRTRSFIETEKGLDRAGYECAVLTAIRDEIRRGNLWVRGSRRYGKLDDFFMPDAEWDAVREQFFAHAGLPADPDAATEYLKRRLGEAYDRFLLGLPKNMYVEVSAEGAWRFGSDPAEQLTDQEQQDLSMLTTWLEDQIRRIRLPDLLIEVDNDLRFSRHFFPDKDAPRTAEGVCQVIATVMAYGCNLGPQTMARLTRGVTYKQIKRMADWQLHEDVLRAALADVVNAISKLDTARVWGEARTSSSDGQRFLFPRKSVKRTYSHRLSDYALEFYSFIMDNYAPFYTTPIECAERDAAYVLDGLLYHEADIDPEEHYTDTHGFTEINHAAFTLLGKRFCPRIRSLSKQRIYHADSTRDYGPLQPMLSRRDRRIHLDWIAEHWDRIAQLFASFAYGHTTASVALKRLVAFGPSNHFYRATRELGRLFKTEFILEYLAQPELRRRVRQGLLKSEELHALARSVFYGKLGRADWRDFQRQMSAASSLLLVLASIIYWQIKEIERVIGEASDEDLASLRLDLLSHMSPIGWENVMLYGQYVLRRELVQV